MSGPPTTTSLVSPTSSLARALTLLHLGGLTRRSELTAELGLTRTATGTVLRELEQLGLVVTRPDAGPGNGTGRPSHGVQISPQAPMALAVHVGVETMVVTEAALGGKLGVIREVPLPDPATPDAVLGRVVDQLRLRLAATMRPCVGIGVALPSAVGDDGTALAANNLYWPHSVPVREVLTGLLTDLGHGSLPLAIGNDANLAALGESRHGAGRGSRHLLLVTTGQRGVGGGLVLNGRPYTGSAGNVLNPDRIVLGGLYADLLRASEMTLRVGLAYRSFLDHAAAVDLRPAALTHSSLVGAAELALQPLLDDPRRGSVPLALP